MTRVYLAAGHGIGYIGDGGGGYDPGAVYKDLKEEVINEQVVLVAAHALIRCGVTTLYDTSAEQRDYMEAINFANAQNVDYAAEVHHNIGSGGGSMGLVGDPVTTPTRDASVHITNALCAALGTRNLGVVSRSREAFNRLTTMPSSIVETSCLDGDYSKIKASGYTTKAGEAIARGLCSHLGVTYKAPTVMTSTALTSATVTRSGVASAVFAAKDYVDVTVTFTGFTVPPVVVGSAAVPGFEVTVLARSTTAATLRVRTAVVDSWTGTCPVHVIASGH